MHSILKSLKQIGPGAIVASATIGAAAVINLMSLIAAREVIGKYLG